MKFQVRIGSDVGPLFTISANSLNDLKVAYDQWVEELAPLNSSTEGAEAYRQRFRGADLYVKQGENFVKL